MKFADILDKYRKTSFSERDKGTRFERLIQSYLLTDPQYANQFKKVWLWSEFPSKNDLGGTDTGIDLVAMTKHNEYWAIQCKCFQGDATIDKPAVDSFLATSSRQFKGENLQTTQFAQRLWISTTNKWNRNAEEAIHNQNPAVIRINLHDLATAQVDWGKLEQGIHGKEARTEKKQLYPHVLEVRDKVCTYFEQNERGRLIMACGTGKTITSLKIAEQYTQQSGTILFLVPSIALIGQTLREWTSQADETINPICICSDPEITKKKTANDQDFTSIIDLAWPASTDPDCVLKQFEHYNNNTPNSGMTVVFSTYQSIEVVAKAQKMLLENGFPEFDLIICDEAHRTTGYTEPGMDSSDFVKVHDTHFIKAKKRLYMTATPRLYSVDAQSQAAKKDIPLWSMDNEQHFGKEIHRIGFGDAVGGGLLTDYKVIILTLSDKDVPPAVQNMVANGEAEIKIDDLSKLIGTINVLSKQFLGNETIKVEGDENPMKRAVAFCGSIANSKEIANAYNKASLNYLESLPNDKKEKMVTVQAKHMDGTMSAPNREEMLAWLKEETPDNECRIITNVRVLSEGVDVPSLDAVLFIAGKNSTIDVVQSVGRVMRKAPGKKYGYIIIPIIIPSDVQPEDALGDNEKYKVVWTVLNALRSHDNRFNATVNQIELNKKRPGQIIVGGTDTGFDGDGKPIDKGGRNGNDKGTNTEIDRQIRLQFEQLQDIIYARMVQKVGDRRYWEQWASDVAQIAERQMERIKYIVTEKKEQHEAFDKFLSGLQQNINPSINDEQAIEMLAQHLITQPIFDALFEGYSFVKNNAVSISMQTMIDALDKGSNFAEQDETLQKFYESVRKRAQGIDNADGKQRIIIELYDKFFKTAFPKMVEKLGIVYTPIEIVDFIIQSVNDILQKEFDRSISDENIQILDPFTGTGTFMVRLLQSGVIDPKDLKRKYRHELHANEIVLLAYYIATINIENAYHDQTPDLDDGVGKTNYTPFEGIVLTDTFQLSETNNSHEIPYKETFVQNSERVEKQKKAPLRIIIGNPPYSVGQKSANDNAQNQAYPKLDKRIADTYAKNTDATNKNSLYDSYLKAFRWSADRLGKEGGIICFVSNGAWLDGNSTDGFRKTIEKEFSAIYVFNLRGNQRTSGELSRREGGKIFGSGSRTPIAITLLVKNPEKQGKVDREMGKDNTQNSKPQTLAKIHYYDIGDYLNREEKLKKIAELRSFGNPNFPFTTLQPNQQGDWISVRNDVFATFIPIGDKEDKTNKTFFVSFYSRGLASARDAYCYNSSKLLLHTNINSFIDYYEEQRIAYSKAKKENPDTRIENFINFATQKVTWNRGLKNDLERNTKIVFQEKSVVISSYRPFFKQHLYLAKELNDMLYQIPKLFPNPKLQNLVVCVPGIGDSKEFSCLISNCIPDLGIIGASQAFPLYYYEEKDIVQTTMFDTNDGKQYARRDAISDFILERAQKQYGKRVIKEDIFYYVYGFLHSKEYRSTFANDLKKMLPRLPLVESVKDFWAFSKAGRALADLHLNYESQPTYSGVVVLYGGIPKAEIERGLSEGGEMEAINYKVTKMRFPKKDQKDTIIYNHQITIENIPAKAYDYVVNGKSAIEWVMERYQITTHKESGITNNPNDWAAEVGNPRYILDLLLSVINISVQTVDIVNGLPKQNFD